MSDKAVGKVELATATLGEGFNCSQAVLSAWAPDLGLDHETALRVAGAFGGGIARMGQTCGAVSGALMALGLKYSQIRANDKQAKEEMYALAGEFMKRFEARHVRHSAANCWVMTSVRPKECSSSGKRPSLPRNVPSWSHLRPRLSNSSCKPLGIPLAPFPCRDSITWSRP